MVRGDTQVLEESVCHHIMLRAVFTHVYFTTDRVERTAKGCCIHPLYLARQPVAMSANFLLFHWISHDLSELWTPLVDSKVKRL